MNRPIRAFAAIGAAAVVLSVAGCTGSNLPSIEAKSDVSLPQQWEQSSHGWVEEGYVHDLFALSDKVAYAVSEKGSDQFVLADAEKEVLRLGQPKELTDNYGVDVRAHHVDGKVYLVVEQQGEMSELEREARGTGSSSHASIVTGFDQDGKQLYRNVTTGPDALSPAPANPVTGLPRLTEDWVIKDGMGYMYEETVDGVDVNLASDSSTGKIYATSDRWKQEIASHAHISSVGPYVRISTTDSSTAKEDFCRILDPHTGKFVAEESAVGKSCAEASAVGDAIIFKSDQKTLDHPRGVLLPKEGKSREFTIEEQFVPASVDTDGTIYGFLSTPSGAVAASTSIDSKEAPKPIEGAERAPVVITKTGIAAFSIDSAEGVQGRMIFAVKK